MLNYRLNMALAQEREMMIAEAARETMQMDLQIQRNLENDVIRVEQANTQINQANERVLPLLETLTGQKLAANPEAWRKWWTEQLGYVYDDRYSNKPTLTDSVAVADLTVVAPSVFLGIRQHRAVFCGGHARAHD